MISQQSQTLERFGKIISQYFRFKSLCLVCKLNHPRLSPVCDFCDSLFVRIGSHCQTCAKALPDTSLMICGGCIKSPPALDQCIVPFSYQEPLRKLLHQYKYGQALYLTKFFATHMAAVLKTHGYAADVIVPTPSHVSRLKERGYNHANLLGHAIAKSVMLPYAPQLLMKVKQTPTQASLTLEGREVNLKNAFRAKAVGGLRVLLVDDLITTGNTAFEMARTLKASGALSVGLLCLARA